MKQLHLHLLSDSTGETLDMLAKACLAQFDTVEAIPHLWPMVRSEGHLERVLDDVERRPGLVLYTVVNPAIRRELTVPRFGLRIAVNAIDPERGWKVDLIFRKERPFSVTEFSRRRAASLMGVEVSIATSSRRGSRASACCRTAPVRGRCRR